MSGFAEILADVRTHLDIEIQAGRRHQPLDAAAAAAILAPAPATPPPAAPAPASAAAPAPAAPRLRAAAASESGPCGRCPLAASGARSVAGSGRAEAPEIMFVGDAPGSEEALGGGPFAGPAGQLLGKMVAAMGLAPDEVFVTYAVRCRPPEGRTPSPEELESCLGHLRRQIDEARPKVLVALGATAFRGLSGDPGANISNKRGLWTAFEGIPLMPTFHPDYLLRAPAAKRLVWDDLKKVLSRLGREPPQASKR